MHSDLQPNLQPNQRPDPAVGVRGSPKDVQHRHNCPVIRRFLTLQDVADSLNVSASQAYALVRHGELRAVKLGGRGQWRVEESELDAFIERAYQATEQYISTHPFSEHAINDVDASELAE
jgi:excisionase family DNA binding protein